jgi:plastocyanin
MRHLLLAVLGLLLLVPACGGDDEGGGDEGAPPSGEVVDVTLRDFTIDPSTINVEPGTYTFHVVNDGATVHALEVEGPSGEVETSDLEPGDSADLTVDLGEDGEFEMYCPVDGHKDRGMEGTVAVGAGAAGGGAGTTTDETTTDEDRGYGY